jgi:AbrB family looped-hinge helix DNA binding protein
MGSSLSQDNGMLLDMAHKRATVPHESYVLHLGDRGRLVLPARLRKRLALKNGEELLLTVEDDGAMEITTRRQRLNRAQGMFAHIQPHRILSKELIRERRREARREEK